MSKTSRAEKQYLNQIRRESLLQGKGAYIYQNNTSGDLMLPRPTKSGKKMVFLKEEFQGDDYYIPMVRNGELKLVRVIDTGESALNEGVNMSERLITEQPPVVTSDGKVEFVVQDKKSKKLNETPDNEPNTEVLLTEAPIGSVELI